MPSAVLSSAAMTLRWSRPLVNCLLPITILRGPTQAGREGTVLLAGEGPRMDDLPLRFFQTQPKRERLGTCPLWSLRRRIERDHPEADLIFLRVDRISARILFRDGYLHVPEWVGTRLTVPDDLTDISRRSHSLKEDLRVIRREGYEAEFSFDPADCEAFFHNVYQPYSLHRFGASDVVRQLYQIRRSVRRGGIVWVCRGSERVSGAVFELGRDTLRFLCVGTAGGRPELRKVGAIAAVYYFLIRYARDQGIARLDYRGSRAHLADGVLRYKCKWGAVMDPQPLTDFDYLVRWPTLSDAVRCFLEKTPLIFRSPGGLAAVSAARHEHPPGGDADQETCRRLSLPGLEKIYVLPGSSDACIGDPNGFPGACPAVPVRAHESARRAA